MDSGRLLRLIAGLAAVSLVLAILWQTGLLFGVSNPAVVQLDEPVNLRRADVGIDTPSRAGLQAGLKPGNLAPDFEFSDYSGERLRLSSFRGRPVVVNFWASWCGPCRAEMPELEAAIGRYQARSLAIIGVNNGETYKNGRRFLDDVEVKLSAFAFDPEQDIVRRYAVQGMPTTYFLDSDGVITRVVMGALNERLLQSAVDEAIIGWGRVERRVP